MGIGPAPNLGPLGAIRPSDAELPVVARIDNSAGVGKHLPGRKQQPARPDDDFAEIAGEKVAEASAAGADPDPEGNISFFA
jgi:hypothetical protein